LKKITWTQIKAFLKTYFDTIYQAAGSYLTSANITQVITNGVTDKAPSEDAVFDALAAKKDTLVFTMLPATLSPADSTTYYFTRGLTPNTTAANHALKFGYDGKITGAVIIAAGNSAAGSTENNTLNFRNITQATSTLISDSFKTNGSATVIRNTTVTGLSISFLSTDNIALEWITPAYSSNPTVVGVTVYLTIEKTS
jgi:outer membrane protein W